MDGKPYNWRYLKNKSSDYKVMILIGGISKHIGGMWTMSDIQW